MEFAVVATLLAIVTLVSVFGGEVFGKITGMFMGLLVIGIPVAAIGLAIFWIIIPIIMSVVLPVGFLLALVWGVFQIFKSPIKNC